jgi:hypothetical protein
MELTKYEIEVLNLMLNREFSNEELVFILNSPITGYDYTGAGYFLELTNKCLPIERRTISEPTLYGRANSFNVGFLVFIEDCKLILECHSWGVENPPDTIREEQIEIIEFKQGILNLNGIYKIENVKNVYIVELESKEEIDNLEISQITQVIDGEERMNWQSPYDEKYLNSSNEIIGDWIDIPKSIRQGEKIIFFFHELNLKKPIRTQFGDLETSNITEVPKWVSEIMEYEEP